MKIRAVFKSNVGLDALRLVKSRAFSGFYKRHYERILKNQSKRIVFLICLVFITMAAVAAVDTSNKTVIKLPEIYIVPDVNTQSIRLGDIAQSIRSADPEMQQKLENLVVMKAPETGKQSRLASHYVIQSIRRAGLDFFNLQFEGARLVEVFGYGQEIKIKDLVSRLTSQILEKTGWDTEELILRIISVPPKDLWLPPGKTEVDMERISPTRIGTTRYQVRFFSDHVLIKDFPIIVSIAHRRKAYAPVRNMKRGEIIAKNDVRETTVYFDKQTLDEQAVDNLEELIGQRCRTPIRKGSYIKWNSLDTNYVMNRGDIVQMILRNGGLTLQTSGKALKRGAKGDVIPIKLDATGRMVRAQIIQRGVVEFVPS